MYGLSATTATAIATKLSRSGERSRKRKSLSPIHQLAAIAIAPKRMAVVKISGEIENCVCVVSSYLAGVNAGAGRWFRVRLLDLPAHRGGSPQPGADLCSAAAGVAI